MKCIFYLLFVVTLVACNSKTTNKNTQENIIAVTEATPDQEIFVTQDSIQIQDLVRAVYAWNEKHLKNYFNIGIADDQGVNYLGIDWQIFDENKKALLATGYFANDFIENYKTTLQHIEQNLNAEKYNEAWKVGYMPPFGTGANEWCHCQDTPSPDFYKYLEIHDLKLLSNNRISLYWNWGTDVNWNTDFKYPLEVIKENGAWKIAYLDGFDQKYY